MKRRQFLKNASVAGVGSVAAASALAAPAIAQDRVNLSMVTTWPRDFPGLGTGAQRLAARLDSMSDGRIQVEYFAAGERVGAFDSFDEVAAGYSEAYHAAEYYWKGKHPGWAFFTSVPFGLTYTEMNAWIRFGGGQELWDELAAQFDLKGVMAGNTGVQMGGWFAKEINTAEDLRGLKMRIPGLGGDVMAKLGVSPISVPGGQIYENLISGAIDATEWVGPWNDRFLKFYEATQFYYFPGMHEPGSMLAFTMNKGFWEGLSSTDQLIIEAAAAMENDVMMAEFNAKNGEALQDLVDNQGVKLRQFSDEIYDSFGAASTEVYEEIRGHSDLSARILDSFLAARDNLGAWSKISDQAYVAQRNRVLGV
jgi:TRAP-type mannitol/chloroaromatic compound transport system substrate-binding protein